MFFRRIKEFKVRDTPRPSILRIERDGGSIFLDQTLVWWNHKRKGLVCWWQ